MIYLSRDGRWMLERLGLADAVWSTIWDVERAVLNHDRAVVLSHLLAGQEIVTLVTRTTLADAVLLSDPHQAAYRWVCEQFVTRDFDRKAQVGLADICRRFPAAVVEAVGKRCKAGGHYGLQYLVAAVQGEGDGEVEAIRREARLNAQIVASEPTAIPPLRRPGFFTTALETMEEGDRFRRAVKGDDRA